MASRTPNSRDSLRNRPGGNTTRRTWSSNGVNFTSESSTYSRPGMNMVFETHTTTAGSGQARAQRSQGSGLLGTAFNLLGGMLASGQQTAQQRRGKQARQPHLDDMAYGEYEEEDDDEDVGTNQRPPSIIGTFKEKLANAQQQRSRAAPRPRRPSPVRRESTRSGTSGRSRRYRDNRRRPSHASSSRSVYSESETSEDLTSEDGDFDSEDNELPPQPKPRRAFTANDASTINVLENAAEQHRRKMEKCQKKFNAVSGQSRMDTTLLQSLLNELKIHEKAYENAKENVRLARSGTTNNARQTPQRSNSSTQTRSARNGRNVFSSSIHEDPLFQMFFQPGTSNGAYYASATHDPFDPFGAQFAALHNVFEGFGTRPTTVPQATFTFSRQSNGPRRTSMHTGPQFPRPMPGFATASAAPRSQPAPPPAPPQNLLRPDEAKRLFETYNERWIALAPADPSIPYPTRGYKPSALCVRDSIWAPTLDYPVATWSEEHVMQANAQAFYLGVVGLLPTYTEAPATGKLCMGYNKAKASPAQTKELIDILKKEKMRWHSDRLGRRNGGASSAGPNEELQTDERTRAVFHAVCELMNVAQDA